MVKENDNKLNTLEITSSKVSSQESYLYQYATTNALGEEGEAEVPDHLLGDDKITIAPYDGPMATTNALGEESGAEAPTLKDLGNKDDGVEWATTNALGEDATPIRPPERPVDDTDLRPPPERPVDDTDLRPPPERPVDDTDLRPPPERPVDDTDLRPPPERPVDDTDLRPPPERPVDDTDLRPVEKPADLDYPRWIDPTDLDILACDDFPAWLGAVVEDPVICFDFESPRSEMALLIQNTPSVEDVLMLENDSLDGLLDNFGQESSHSVSNNNKETRGNFVELQDALPDLAIVDTDII